MLAILGTVFLLGYIAHRSRIFIQNTLLLNGVPRITTFIPPVSLLSFFLPRGLLKYGILMAWDYRENFSLYKNAPLKTIISEPLSFGGRAIFTANLAVMRQALATGSLFRKVDTGLLDPLGANLLTTEGEIWRRHRRIAAPAFNHRTYQNVWDTTADVYDEMSKKEGWTNVNEVRDVNINEITHKLALFLIAIVGFGLPMKWDTPAYDENGRRSIQSIVFDVSATVMIRGTLPKWAYSLGIKQFNDIDEAYKGFEKYMVERIAERDSELRKIYSLDGQDSEELADSIKDVLGRLVNSRITEGKLTMTDEEIIGNCFIFAFAGHETTAITLGVTLAELALNTEVQDWLYNGIIKVIGDRTPVFEDFDSLDCVQACFLEGLRLYPAAPFMFRSAIQDHVISVPSPTAPNKKEDIYVKKGDAILLDLVGSFHDPELYANAEEFYPQRWLDSVKTEKQTSITEDKDAGEISGLSPATSMNGFVGFSLGPRTCIGHKFAKVEAVAFLTYLLKDWKVEPALRPGETKEEWKRKFVSSATLNVTLRFDDVHLKLSRRKSS